jgi:hypothetical protein
MTERLGSCNSAFGDQIEAVPHSDICVGLLSVAIPGLCVFVLSVLTFIFGLLVSHFSVSFQPFPRLPNHGRHQEEVINSSHPLGAYVSS